MAKYLDWYLVELERKLESSLGHEDLYELLSQTRDHIGMIKYELMFTGMDEELAEQAAISRFGTHEGLTSKIAEKPTVRPNWASPALIIVFGFVIFGSSMIFGSSQAMVATAVVGVFCLLLAALLCGRRGTLPSAAFGILLIGGFTGLSGIFGAEFRNYRVDYLRNSDSPALMRILEGTKAEATLSQHRINLARTWIAGSDMDDVPKELRAAGGVLAPAPDRPTPMYGFDPLRRSDAYNLTTLCGQSNNLRYLLQEMPQLEVYKSVRSASIRWGAYLGDSWNYTGLPQKEQFDPALAALKRAPKYEFDNLFTGVCVGFFATLIWIALAWVSNRIANLQLGRSRRDRSPHRSYA